MTTFVHPLITVASLTKVHSTFRKASPRVLILAYPTASHVAYVPPQSRRDGLCLARAVDLAGGYFPTQGDFARVPRMCPLGDTDERRTRVTPPYLARLLQHWLRLLLPPLPHPAPVPPPPSAMHAHARHTTKGITNAVGRIERATHRGPSAHARQGASVKRARKLSPSSSFLLPTSVCSLATLALSTSTCARRASSACSRSSSCRPRRQEEGFGLLAGLVRVIQGRRVRRSLGAPAIERPGKWNRFSPSIRLPLSQSLNCSVALAEYFPRGSVVKPSPNRVRRDWGRMLPRRTAAVLFSQGGHFMGTWDYDWLDVPPLRPRPLRARTERP